MMTTKHKHFDLIVAWANGAEIEQKDYFNIWNYRNYPDWSSDRECRVRLETKIDVVLYAIAYPCNFDGSSAELSRGYYFGYYDSNSNLKLTYDAETKKLKAVELI